MNSYSTSSGFTVINGSRSLALREGSHYRMYPIPAGGDFLTGLTARQADLLRISMAVHVADSWIKRRPANNKHRRPVVKVEVFDTLFWSHPETYQLLKEYVDFLSGGDDWAFRFQTAVNARHIQQLNLFRGQDRSAVVTLYSGGLDSAAGLAGRLAMEPGRLFIPVFVRHQMQKGKLVRDHYNLLIERGLVRKKDLIPFPAGAFVRKITIKKELEEDFREETHRCRPMLFMAAAGLVADSVASSQVEVLESGVGSLNLPLITGPADFRTTRSSHPRTLKLMSDLMSHVNEAPLRFVLPFASLTKGEMVAKLRELDLEELARRSVSCILHPLQRPSGKQCGYCPACVYRRQAMIAGGITESSDAYEVDLFSPTDPSREILDTQLRTIRAFHQQASRLAELDSECVPNLFIQYLYATQAIKHEAEIGPYVEVYRRYQREWAAIVADARRRNLPWVKGTRSMATAQGVVR